jgi:NADPH-dependent 2,4-dienoyl-CoA reductase/sulfur reductase-like enzyme
VQPAAPKRVAETPERVAKVFARAEEAAADARDVKGMDAAGADANAWSVGGSPPFAPTRTPRSRREKEEGARRRDATARVPPGGAAASRPSRRLSETDRARRPTTSHLLRPRTSPSCPPRVRRYLSPPVSPREVTAEAPLRVLVAGGGLAGLVTAAAATSKGMQVSCHTM